MSRQRSRQRMNRRQQIPWLLMVGGTTFCLFGVPLLASGNSCWLLALVPFFTLGYSQFAVVHEAIHGNLHPQRALNQSLGRVSAILFGSPFAFLRDVHLLHHKYNRTLGHPDLYEPSAESLAVARVRYLFDLFLGLYLKEFGVGVLCLLPRRLWANAQAAQQGDLNARLLSGIAHDKKIGQTRFDSVCMLVVYAASFALYGHRAGFLGAALIGRALAVSFHDNVYHYRTDPKALLYGHNLSLPPVLRWLMLNFNYHGIHHAAPGVPWYELPQEFTRRGGSMAGPWLRSALKQLAGPFPKTEPATQRDSTPLASQWSREA